MERSNNCFLSPFTGIVILKSSNEIAIDSDNMTSLLLLWYRSRSSGSVYAITSAFDSFSFFVISAENP